MPFTVDQEPELPEISFQDYAYWLQNRDSKTVAGEESYWKERMEGAGELLDLPVDKQRPKTFDYQGENVVFSLEEKTAVLCAEFCKKEDYSPYMLFAAAFASCFLNIREVRILLSALRFPAGGSRSFGMFWGRF